MKTLPTSFDKGIFYMLISVVCFSLMNLSVKFLPNIPATELVLFRSLVSLVLSFVMIKKRKLNPFGNHKKYLILRGVFGVTALTLFFYTLQKLPLGSAITIQYLSPIFTVIFAVFLLKEPVKKMQWLFFTLAFAGILVIKGFDTNITLPLFLMGLGSAIFAGLAYNCISLLKNTDHPVVVVFYFPLIATPVMLVFSLFNWQTPHGIEWLLLLLMGVLTQIAQIYMTKAFHTSDMNKVAPLKYLGILMGIGFDVFIFGLVYKPLTLVGIVMVVTGIVLNIGYKSRTKAKQNPLKT